MVIPPPLVRPLFAGGLESVLEDSRGDGRVPFEIREG